VLVAGAALTLAALAFDATILLVPGLAFLLLGGLLPVWIWLEVHSVRADRILASGRVLEGTPLPVRIRVRRAGAAVGLRRWLARVEVVDPLGGTGQVGRGGEVALALSFPRRGRQQLEPPALRLSDPLGLVTLVRASGSAAQEVLVLPRTEPVRWARGGGRAAWEGGLAGVDEPWGASDVDGLRSYRQGTPAARIHWPALARGAGLLERRLRTDGDSLPVVVLDPRSPGHPELLDAAVRAAASLTLELARRRGCELLLPGERRPIRVGRDLGAWPDAHARLALVDDTGARSAPRLAPGLHGPVVYVAASALVDPLRRGLSEAVLVIPAQAAGPRQGKPRFQVSGCQGYVLSQRGRTAAAGPRERVP